MRIQSSYESPRRTPIRLCLGALLLTLAACSHWRDTREPFLDKAGARAQLSIGYSLLHQEADGIPKLKWLLLFKDKREEMAQLTNDLVHYYQHLAETMERLATQFPAMRIDVTPMSQIESEERKSIGADLAKDFAPLVGKAGVEFEREALLMFLNSLNEQRHLVAVMAEREPDAALKKFLETTRNQLDDYHAKVGALLNRRYFKH